MRDDDGRGDAGDNLREITPGDSVPHDTHERRREVRRLWRAETGYFATLAAFAALAVFARLNAYFAWDLSAARALQALAVPGFAGLMDAASFFGNNWHPWFLTTVTVLLFFFFHRRSEAAGLLLSAGGGELVNRLVKILIARPRPSASLVSVAYAEHSESFPSGHVTFYVCFFGFLFFVAYALLARRTNARRLALALAVLPVSLIGFSRVYLGEHWPSDAIGAYLLSGLWLALSLHLYRRWKKRATFHPQASVVDEKHV
ncbi:MAG: phosphatase PAP2 family protein [Acidobacteria bacterium]|nr:phosphatase PAP2 family protein [Acidobacteriota bacterium]